MKEAMQRYAVERVKENRRTWRPAGSSHGVQGGSGFAAHINMIQTGGEKLTNPEILQCGVSQLTTKIESYVQELIQSLPKQASSSPRTLSQRA